MKVISYYFQRIALVLLFVSQVVVAAEEMVFRWDKADKLVFDEGTLEFNMCVSFWEGDTKIFENYSFYYQKETRSESLTFPVWGDQLLNAIISIKDIKDGGIIERDKDFRISRKGAKITIAITPPYGNSNKPDEPELITVALADAVTFSNKVAKHIEFIRKAFRIEAKTPTSSDSPKPEEKNRAGMK